jgi:ribosomal protein RSM22 (predicted rRNA methylase)
MDIGAGPGTASWAAMDRWPSIARIEMRDTNASFLAAAKAIADASGIEALMAAQHQHASLQTDMGETDLALAAYVFAELPTADAVAAARKIWRSAAKVFIVVEPGTPKGFERIRAIRQMLIAEGAHIVAPCPHANACPISGSDWCHFSVRLARSREHMHAKQAALAYEDEPFSYVAASRMPIPSVHGRILARPSESKHDISFKLCTSLGIEAASVATRSKAAYKQARKLQWGDAFTLNDTG